MCKRFASLCDNASVWCVCVPMHGMHADVEVYLRNFSSWIICWNYKQPLLFSMVSSKIIPSPMITNSIFMEKTTIHTHEMYTDWQQISHRKRSRFSLTTQLFKVNTNALKQTHTLSMAHSTLSRTQKSEITQTRVVCDPFAWQNLTYSIT